MPVNPNIIIETGKEIAKTGLGMGVGVVVVEKGILKATEIVAVPLAKEVVRVSRDVLLKNAAIQIGVATALQVAPAVPQVVTNVFHRVGYKGFSRGIEMGKYIANEVFREEVRKADLPTLIIMVHEMASTNAQYSTALSVFKAAASTFKFVSTVAIGVVIVNIAITKYTLYQTLLGFMASARSELSTYLARNLDYNVYTKALNDLAACKTVQEVQLLMLSINKIAINS